MPAGMVRNLDLRQGYTHACSAYTSHVTLSCVCLQVAKLICDGKEPMSICDCKEAASGVCCMIGSLWDIMKSHPDNNKVLAVALDALADALPRTTASSMVSLFYNLYQPFQDMQNLCFVVWFIPPEQIWGVQRDTPGHKAKKCQYASDYKR